MFYRKLFTKDQNIWVTSDLHFYHNAILKFASKTRPFKDVENMKESIISEWNSKVCDDDIIFHLGDFSFKAKTATESILERLNGRKVFILGNHDKALREKVNVGDFGIEFIGHYLEIRVDGVKVCMSHFPISAWNQQGNGSVMLHGHTHGKFQGEGRIVDVGYDNFGEIIPINKAIDYCLQREVYCPDNHKIKVEV